MDIILNELSLDGSFANEDAFLDSLPSFLKKTKQLASLSASILKHYNLYDCKVTSKLTLREIFLKSRDDRVTRTKSLMLQLMESPPFWQDDRRHDLQDHYACKYTQQTNDYGLAEACERNKIVLSFDHNDFATSTLEITKNHNLKIVLYNFSEEFADYFYSNQLINELQYCSIIFKDTKIDFSKYEDEFGFETLELPERRIFIESFRRFAVMDWNDILKSDSLKYKRYDPSSDEDNWFKNTPYDGKVDKYRVSERFRCFGVREGEVFYVLRFERDHKKSDKG